MFVRSTRVAFILIVSALAILARGGLPALAQIDQARDVFAPVSPLYTIRIPLVAGQHASLVDAEGLSRDLGKVRVLPWKTKYPGFTASSYGDGGQIVASGANALHVLVDVENGHGRTLSILPTSTFVATAGIGSSLYLEGVGGIGLWGAFAPPVGSPVFIVNQIGAKIPLNDVSLLKYAQAIEIDVFPPVEDVEYLEIENRVGGRAFWHDSRGDHLFGLVDRPVSGTGRFSGTLYQERSRVRANHPGVICVSTSPAGKIGGFQIVPRNHTFSPEMRKTQRMDQWLILRGPDFEDLTGRFPFFFGALRPGDRSVPGDREGTVVCRVNGGAWEPLPEAEDVQPEALKDVTAIRIYVR